MDVVREGTKMKKAPGPLQEEPWEPFGKEGGGQVLRETYHTPLGEIIVKK